MSQPDGKPNSPRLDGMYQEILLEHSRDPRNFGQLKDPDFAAEGYNPLCGDKVRVQMKLASDGKAESLRFHGEACSICTASASIMTEEAQGKDLGEIQNLISDFRALMQSQKEASDFEGDLSSLAGVRNFPVRIKCALLPWTTLKEAIELKAASKGEPS